MASRMIRRATEPIEFVTVPTSVGNPSGTKDGSYAVKNRVSGFFPVIAFGDDG